MPYDGQARLIDLFRPDHEPLEEYLSDRSEIRARIAEILGRIVDEDLTLEDSTVADDIEGWDSINHVKLVIALERVYKIEFQPDEVTSPNNVGELVDLISNQIEKVRAK